MSLDDDLRRSLPSQQALRAMTESVRAIHKAVGFEVLRDAKKLGIGQVMTDAQWRSMRGVIHDALPKIDFSQIAGMTRGLEREQPGMSPEWLAAEAERRWAGVETRDAVYALREEVEAARADATVAREEVRAAARLNLWLTIALLALAIPSGALAIVALIALL